MIDATHEFSGIHSGTCKEGNEVSSKLGCHLILKSILGMHIDPDSIPDQDEMFEVYNTIVEAEEVRAAEGVEVELA